MLAISRDEFLATGSRSTRWFHGLSEGKISQRGALGSGCAETSAGIAAPAHSASSTGSGASGPTI